MRHFFFPKRVLSKTAKTANIVKCKNCFYSISAKSDKIEWKKFRADAAYLRKETKELKETREIGKGEEQREQEKQEEKEEKTAKTYRENSREPLLRLSGEAVKKLKEINSKYHGRKILKISVEAGGCSGFQYSFSLINRNQIKEKEIIAYDKEECLVLIDRVALDILKDSEVHYTNDLIARKFVIQNIKNVSSKCSCGNSFDLKLILT